MYLFILQQDNTQNMKPEGQQGSVALTAAYRLSDGAAAFIALTTSRYQQYIILRY